MGTFDPATFLDTALTEANSTTVTPIPDGEYPAVIESVDVRPWQGRADPSKSGLALDVVWDVDDPGVRQILGRDKVTVKQGVMLDLNTSGGIDTGKGRNDSLGRLREAVGLNIAGRPFSFRQLVGQVAKIKVTQRVDGDQIYNDVKGVARLA